MRRYLNTENELSKIGANSCDIHFAFGLIEIREDKEWTNIAIHRKVQNAVSMVGNCVFP